MIKKRMLNEAKFSDGFKLSNDKKTIVGFNKQDAADEFGNKFKKDKNGKWKFEGEEHDYAVSDDMQDKIAQLVDKWKKNNKSSHNNNEYNTPSTWENIGKSLCFLVIHNLTDGKMKGFEASGGDKNISGEKFAESVKPEDMLDRFKNAFKNIDEIDDNFLKKNNIFQIMDNFAARAAYHEAKNEDKLNQDQLDKYGTEEDGKFKYNIDFIKSNTATKSYYTKIFNEFQDALDEGVKAGKAEVDKLKSGEGGKVKDPLTGQTVSVDKDSFKKQLAKGALNKAGEIAGDLLGINDGKDIFSMAIRGVIGMIKDNGGIRKVLKMGKQIAWKKNGKLKNKDVKKHVDELNKDIEKRAKNKEIPE